jgi:hypothetical protein
MLQLTCQKSDQEGLSELGGLGSGLVNRNGEATTRLPVTTGSPSLRLSHLFPMGCSCREPTAPGDVSDCTRTYIDIPEGFGADPFHDPSLHYDHAPWEIGEVSRCTFSFSLPLTPDAHVSLDCYFFFKKN